MKGIIGKEANPKDRIIILVKPIIRPYSYVAYNLWEFSAYHKGFAEEWFQKVKALLPSSENY